MRAGDLLDRLNDHPFRPFRVHVSDGSIYDLTEPAMVLVSVSSVILPVKWRNDDEGRKIVASWRTVALTHIVQFSDIKKGNGKGRAGRGN